MHKIIFEPGNGTSPWTLYSPTKEVIGCFASKIDAYHHARRMGSSSA